MPVKPGNDNMEFWPNMSRSSKNECLSSTRQHWVKPGSDKSGLSVPVTLIQNERLSSTRQIWAEP